MFKGWGLEIVAAISLIAVTCFCVWALLIGIDDTMLEYQECGFKYCPIEEK